MSAFTAPTTHDGPVNIPHQGTIAVDEKALLIVKKEVLRFMGKHGAGMKTWWAANTEVERQDYILSVYPEILYSTEERWTYKNVNGRINKSMKITHQKYDLPMALWGERFTFRYLATITGTTMGLFDLIGELTAHNALLYITIELVVALRNLITSDQWPFGSATGDPFTGWEQKKALITKPKPGCHMKMLHPKDASDPTVDCDLTDFEGNYVTMSKPEVLLRGTGTINPINGKELNLYEMGTFAHKFEAVIVLQAMNMMYHLVGALIDEYQEEVLGSLNVIRDEDEGYSCKKCGKNPEDKSKLLKCSQCSAAYYCSKECQKADWKMHKGFCNKMKGKLKIGNSWYKPGTTFYTEAVAKRDALAQNMEQNVKGVEKLSVANAAGAAA